MLLRKLCRTVLFKWMGFRLHVTIPIPDKCILCLAPHTSNWDFVIGELYYHAMGKKAGFLMKREWFTPPLGYIWRKMGGIPVNRSRSTSLTDQLATAAAQATYFNLAVTPEGTRKRVTTWKRGFYYIALKAGIPILLFAIDYKEKKIVCTRSITPSGDVESDMRTIMEYYAPFHGKHPENFAIESL